MNRYPEQPPMAIGGCFFVILRKMLTVRNLVWAAVAAVFLFLVYLAILQFTFYASR